MSAQPLPIEDDVPSPADEVADRRVAQTLDMARAFLDAVFDDPSLLDEIPDGANVVFVPADDERLAAANLAAAAEMRGAGNLVHIVHL